MRNVKSTPEFENQLQMDGRHCGHGNRDQTKEVLGVSPRRSNKPSRRSGATEQNMFCSSQFLLEEVFCRYGCVGQVIADRGELHSDKAREFFAKHGVQCHEDFRLRLETGRKGANWRCATHAHPCKKYT